MIDPIPVLSRALGYQFKNVKWLQAAISHRSARGENNERLEFLGDSVLNFVIAAYLFRQYPKLREGDLSRFRAHLVQRSTLAEVALELDLGSHLRLGHGEQKSGGNQRQSILGDALEAIIGAIYCDDGIHHCEERILCWYASRLQNLMHAKIYKDPKTLLQETMQAKRCELPLYQVSTITGTQHAQAFKVECTIPGFDFIAKGEGHSRRAAEQIAAQSFLHYLEEYYGKK